MKLARIGEKGRERAVAIDADGRFRRLSSLLADLTPDMLAPDRLAWLTKTNVEDLPLYEGPVTRYGVPIAGVRKFIAIGLNYSDHAAETGQAAPAEPIIFMKAITSLAGADDDVQMPKRGGKIDWEVELGVVIGSSARYVERDNAMEHVAGYVLVNDLSDREAQLERGGTWDKGKGHDGFGPVGPWFVTADELGEARDLDMFLDVSGSARQRGNTSRMIFDVPTIVSYVSQFMTLEAGDIIATGTPPGVGMGMNPPAFLSVGDEIRLGISGLGEQRQRMIAYNEKVMQA